MTQTICLSVALALAMAARPLWAAGLSDQVQQRRDAELRALQLQIQQQQQAGPTLEASPQRKLQIEQWRRDQQNEQLRLYRQQQRQRRLQPPPQQELQPPQLRPTPQDTTQEDDFRRQREIQRLQRQPPPSR